MAVFSSPAKLNLFLNCTGKVPDGAFAGYHLLESLFVPFPQLHDDVQIEETIGGSSLKMQSDSGQSLPDYGHHNTAFKALMLMQQHFAPVVGLKHANITITKRIPNGAGLGGSSTNAATVINALTDLWQLHAHIAPDILQTQLETIALSIGADVPYFLKPQPAMVRGIGEIIEPLSILGIRCYLLILYPGFASNCIDVYRASPITEFSPLLESTQAGVLSQYIFHGHNALYRNALIKHPVLSEIMAMLKAQNGCITSRISGSGSSCFGIFESLQSLQDAAHNINKSHAHYQIWEYILDI